MNAGSSSPRVVMILQARMGSSRLPGKSTLDLAGAPLVGRIIERVKRSRAVDEFVLATTCKPEDDVLERLAHDADISVFRGSENDLVDRYYQAAKTFGAGVVVRLPADCPTSEPSEIDRIIYYHLCGWVDFSTNIMQVDGNGYPDGIGAEAFSFQILEDVWKNVHDPHHREHIATNYYDYHNQRPVHPERYRVGTVQCPPGFRRPDLVLDVNTPEEYTFMQELYEYLYPRNPEFHIVDLIEWYDKVYTPKQRSEK